MIEEVKCENCTNNCCQRARVGLTVYDIAKVLHLVGDDCEFIESKDGLGRITYKGETFIIIEEDKVPWAYIKPPCQLLSKDLKCIIHNEVIQEDSPLGGILKNEDQQLYGKPLCCAKHPYEYDYESDSIMKLTDCRKIETRLISTGEDKDYIMQALENALYEQRILKNIWTQTGYYPIIEHAESFIKGVKQSFIT